MFTGLRQILGRAVELRHRGQLEVLTMSQIAERSESRAATTLQLQTVARTAAGRETTCAE